MTDFRTYQRNLPHWRLKGAIYFVTFRLADSIPKALLDRWRGERDAWFAAHGLDPTLTPAEWKRRYEAIPEPIRAGFERQQASKFFVELDLHHGRCELRHPEVADMVGGALRFFDGSRLQCGDYVVMPNHVHWLVKPLGDEDLEKLLQSIKRFSAGRINELLSRSGPLWQKESYDHVVRDAEELARIRKYIADNPARASMKSGEYAYYEGSLFDP